MNVNDQVKFCNTCNHIHGKYTCFAAGGVGSTTVGIDLVAPKPLANSSPANPQQGDSNSVREDNFNPKKEK